ncbi:MAG TPA: hypothetical protein EYQ18_05000 [Candidatus Handelsmanbacteria bacterium]|nr:hypothetical protein [Candidatus Handelsmanbacteria bacterium]
MRSVRFGRRKNGVRAGYWQAEFAGICDSGYFRAMANEEASTPVESSSEVTIRALVLGALLAFFLNLACPYTVLVLQNAGLTSDYITAGAMMVFLLLVGLVNPLLKVVRRSWALRTSELVVIYAMMIVASAIPTWGLVTNLFHILTRPFYYATPENRWVDLVQPLIPAWLAPRDPEVARFFYEGLPDGVGIPWGAWMVPLLAWGSAMLAVYLLMIATMVIFRRPWVEQERLVFPLAQLPLEMLRGNDEAIFPLIFRNPLMWLGFSLPFAIQMLDGFNHYFFIVPEIRLLFDPLLLFRDSVRLNIFVNFAIIGVTYFLNLNVAFSVWFFHLLSRFQTGLFNIVGFQVKGHNEALTGSSVALSHQGMGAMLVLVFAIVWTARDHLRRVCRAAFMRDGGIVEGDSDEILSYRAAVWLWVGCAAYFFGWLLFSGAPPLTAVVFCFGAFAIFLAIARVIAQGGVGFTSSTMLPQPFTVYTLGTEAIGWQGLAAISLSYSWAAEMRTSVMASAANALKLAHNNRANHRRLFWGLLIAVVVGLIGASWITLYLNYTHGGINLRQFGVPSLAYRFLEDKINNPIGWEHIRPRLLFTAVGAALMGALIYMQHHFLWWPLHYIGLPVSDSWVMGVAWFSVFLGWVLKAVIFKFAGTRGYVTYKPLFVGLIAGQLMGGAVWMVVDFFLGEMGNVVFVGVR